MQEVLSNTKAELAQSEQHIEEIHEQNEKLRKVNNVNISILL